MNRILANWPPKARRDRLLQVAARVRSSLGQAGEEKAKALEAAAGLPVPAVPPTPARDVRVAEYLRQQGRAR